MGRPPIGTKAMTSTERSRRYRAGLATKPATKPSPTSDSAKDARIRKLEAELEQARKSIADLERRGAGESQLTRSTRGGVRQEFGKLGRLRAEINRLKSDIFKLKAMLQEEPDATKLRKKVVDQRVEMASMRQVMKKIAKERDEYQSRVKSYKRLGHTEIARLLTRQNYNLIIKALHSDRMKQCTAAELATAERLVITLRPLFIEDQ